MATTAPAARAAVQISATVRRAMLGTPDENSILGTEPKAIGTEPGESTPLSVLRPAEPFRQVTLHAIEPHSLLNHAVALTHRNRLIVERVEVDGDAVRRTDLVLPSIATADRAGVVELHVPALAEPGSKITSHRREPVAA